MNDKEKLEAIEKIINKKAEEMMIYRGAREKKLTNYWEELSNQNIKKY